MNKNAWAMLALFASSAPTMADGWWNTRSACDATGHFGVLQTAATQSAKPGNDKPSARALWLNSKQLQWATEFPTDARRFVLAHSPTGQLAVQNGKLRGASTQWSLTLDASPAALQRAKQVLPWANKDAAQRPLLSLGRTLPAELTKMHKGQLWVVAFDANGNVLAQTNTQAALALDSLYAKAQTEPALGGSLTATGRQFKLWAPTAQNVSMCVYPGSGGKAVRVDGMKRDARGIWTAKLSNPSNKHFSRFTYTYLVDVFVPGLGLVRNRVTDPYALSFNANSQRATIIDLTDADLKPVGWTDRAQLPHAHRVQHSTDMVIYELHVRDFSITDETVPTAQRGKFMAFTQRNSNGMLHLRKLSQAGMTDVHFLPIFDIATIPETGCAEPKVPQAAPDSPEQQKAVAAVKGQDCFNWGYDPFHYTAPEGSYASNANDGAVRVRETREMVLALNREGLRVGMDVVYNHTSASGQDAKSVLDRIVPNYYQRLNLAGGVETSTCCANTATEHAMMAKLMIDSAVTWVQEYGIDSFRFDLMGHQPRAVMERLQTAVNQAAGKPVQLIGEGWNFGEVENGARFVQASQLSLNGSGIGTFSDRARDAVRGGSWADDSAGLLANQGWANGFVFDPTPTAPKTLSAADLAAKADQVRVGLAGTLRNYRMSNSSGEVVTLDSIKYGGNAPAGYASQPSEVVNYVDNHDNPTLFDINAFKMPPNTSREDRARAQVVGIAVTALSQGIAYFHAGVETLRSKSLDRNSYDSGDWFNRIDWTLQDNYFGIGLPIEADNGNNWAVMKPLLANPLVRPEPAQIRFAFEATRDLLSIRASSSLFRMRTAQDVQQRLKFHNTGPQQIGSVIVGELDGTGYPGANYKRVVYAINADKQAHALGIAELKGLALQLHPIHRAMNAGDRFAATANFDAATGKLSVPPRTAVVWVLP